MIRVVLSCITPPADLWRAVPVSTLGLLSQTRISTPFGLPHFRVPSCPPRISPALGRGCKDALQPLLQSKTPSTSVEGRAKRGG